MRFKWELVRVDLFDTNSIQRIFSLG